MSQCAILMVIMATISLSIATKVVGVLDTTRNNVSSVYHAQCDVLVNDEQERCCYCKNYRKCLTAMASQASHTSVQADYGTCPSSHTNYMYLKSEEKSVCLHHLHAA